MTRQDIKKAITVLSRAFASPSESLNLLQHIYLLAQSEQVEPGHAAVFVRAIHRRLLDARKVWLRFYDKEEVANTIESWDEVAHRLERHL